MEPKDPLDDVHRTIIADNDADLVAHLLNDAVAVIAMGAESERFNHDHIAKYAERELTRGAYWLPHLRPALVACGFPDLANRAAVIIAEALTGIERITNNLHAKILRHHGEEPPAEHWRREFATLFDAAYTPLRALSREFAGAALLITSSDQELSQAEFSRLTGIAAPAISKGVKSGKYKLTLTSARLNTTIDGRKASTEDPAKIERDLAAAESPRRRQ